MLGFRGLKLQSGVLRKKFIYSEHQNEHSSQVSPSSSLPFKPLKSNQINFIYIAQNHNHTASMGFTVCTGNSILCPQNLDLSEEKLNMLMKKKTFKVKLYFVAMNQYSCVHVIVILWPQLNFFFECQSHLWVYSFYSVSYLFNYLVYFSLLLLLFLNHYCPFAATEKKCPYLWENKGIKVRQRQIFQVTTIFLKSGQTELPANNYLVQLFCHAAFLKHE